ncbi:MAG: hybrid sensor histidine kinase/response regulator [Bacteroidota bacterium]
MQTEKLVTQDVIKVLIIDDLEDNRTLLRLDLEDEMDEVEIDEAQSGEEGLAMMSRKSYSIVICDLMMPGIDGFTTFRRANEQLALGEVPPFIFLSANKQKEVVNEGLKLGAIDYLTKPYELSELIYKVKNLSQIKILTDSLKTSREKLYEANERLKSLNEDKDEVLKIVSHDMRNPLNNIIGLASMLRESEDVDAGEVSQMGEIIERSGEKLLHLVNSLLDVAKIESGAIKVEWEVKDLAKQIKNAVQSVRLLAERKSLKLHLDLPDRLVQVPIDEPKLDQILGNLISNAIKFTPAGGDIYITLKVDTSDPTPAYPATTIEIRDTGIGIPEDLLPHIFDKFGGHQRQGTEAEEGSGLGLSIVKHFVELMDGTIQVESDEGEGTSFQLQFPARD